MPRKVAGMSRTSLAGNVDVVCDENVPSGRFADVTAMVYENMESAWRVSCAFHSDQGLAPKSLADSASYVEGLRRAGDCRERSVLPEGPGTSALPKVDHVGDQGLRPRG